MFILLGKVQAFLVVRLGPGRNGTTTPSWLESEVSYVFLAILECLYFIRNLISTCLSIKNRVGIFIRIAFDIYKLS